MIGKTVSHYEIVEQLGHGGMGIVYKARDTMLERAVALKMLHSSLAQDEVFLKRFRAEAKALAQLENPNIVTVFDLLEIEAGIFIVMQYVEGETLADKIARQGPIPFPEALAIFKQILDALEHAHQAGIIHRDIKPGNVIITPQGVVKVTDFGLAKVQQASIFTLSGITGGTLYYMPPEQIRNLALTDRRSDIYAAGMTLYEMLAGQLPFDKRADIYEISRVIVKKRFPPPTHYQPALPRRLAAMVMKAIAKEPEKRYQSAEEMRESLQQFEQQHLLAEEKGSGPGRRLSRHIPGAVAFPLLALILLLLFSTLALLLVPGLKQRTLQALGLSSYARLSIHTHPQGMQVILNGKKLRSPTPIDKYLTRPDTIHLQILDSLGYLTLDTALVLQAGQHSRVFYELPSPERSPDGLATPASQWGGLEISSNPPGAAITLDGQRVGKTPYHQDQLLPGRYRLGLRLPGYREVQRTVEVNAGELTRLSVQLERALSGILALKINPPANIYINDKLLQQNAAQYRAELSAGLHRLKVVHPTLGVWETSFQLEANSRYETECDFTREYTLRVAAVNEAGEALYDAEIYVDGANTGKTTPALLTLRFGQHQIAVQLEGYKAVNSPRKISVEGNLAEPLEFKLRRLP